MNDRSSESILTGRPFGGVAIPWNKWLSTSISCIDSDDQDGRFISVKLLVNDAADIIITCVYFTCKKSNIEYVQAL